MIRRIANQRLDVKWIDRMWVRGRAPQHSMLPESRVTWPWPGPSSPQSSILCTYLHKHLTELYPTYLHKHLTPQLINTKVESARGLLRKIQLSRKASFSAITMDRCIALIASYLCRYVCFESISSERVCICTELICICTETADQGGISRVGAATDLFGTNSKAALRSFSDVVLFQCVLFLGRI